MVDPTDQPGFLDDGLFRVLIACRMAQELERDVPVDPRVPRAEDVAESAPADVFADRQT